jgi:putative PIN family toxin of toxin-antitoxin system
MQQITVCLDANIYISGIAFGGKPLKILEKALNRDFHLVTGPNILDEVRRNLVSKLGVKPKRVDQFLSDISEVSSVFVPTGKVHFINHTADNLVLELAIAGSCDVLVTGDKKHLLPLGTFSGVTIESPSAFLIRLDSIAK